MMTVKNKITDIVAHIEFTRHDTFLLITFHRLRSSIAYKKHISKLYLLNKRLGLATRKTEILHWTGVSRV